MTTYILSQFRGRRWRTLGVVAGVAVGTSLFVLLSALGEGFRQAARAPLDAVAADVAITRPAGPAETSASTQTTRGVRMPFGMAAISNTEVETIRRTGGVAAVASALQVWDFGPTSYQTVLGLDPDQTAVGPGHALVDGIVAGRSFGPSEHGVALADRHYAAFFRLKPGSTVTIGGQQFELVGVVEQQGASQTAAANLYVPLADAQFLASLSSDQVNQVYLQVASAGDLDTITKHLTEQLGDLSIISEDSLVQVMGGVGRVSARFSEVIAAIGLFSGLALAWLTLTSLVTERQREIGLMKAVGWQARDVARVFLLEAILLSSAGGLLGIALGWGGSLLLGGISLPESATPLNNTLPGLSVATPILNELTLPAQASPTVLALALIAAMLGGTLAGWSEARRAAGLKPAQTLRRG